MEGFSISEHSRGLVEPYPASEILWRLASAITEDERHGLVRLWLSEGIPFAFRDSPMLYETVRNWLGVRLTIHPKLVTVVGSARIGYSLAPAPRYGSPFGPNSDMDLAVVSADVFAEVCDAFFRWETDVSADRVRARGEREKALWEDNLQRVPFTISKGFVDPYKIPCWNRYRAAQRIKNLEWVLGQKLKLTAGAPQLKNVSIRVYQAWDALTAQMRLNLRSVLR